jgi:hypothetical protein
MILPILKGEIPIVGRKITARAAFSFFFLTFAPSFNRPQRLLCIAEIPGFDRANEEYEQ